VRPTRARFAEVVRSEPVDVGLACLLVGGEVDPDVDVDVSLELLEGLAAETRSRLYGQRAPRDVAETMRRVLGVEFGFRGGPEDYDDVRSSLLHEVLLRRRGLPILLSVVWMEVAARVGVRAYAVGLPGHVVVGIGDLEDEHVLVDPYDGGTELSRADVSALVLQTTGAPLQPEHLAALAPTELLTRLLNNVRVLAMRQPPGLESAAMRLWAVELTLLLPVHPVQLRRERGELRVRLGDHLGGAEELETYALVVEATDEAAATEARREARLARAQLN
jgi:regulator of sirC expression with transglutaminase-like and TPR domain